MQYSGKLTLPLLMQLSGLGARAGREGLTRKGWALRGNRTYRGRAMRMKSRAHEGRARVVFHILFDEDTLLLAL